MIKINIYRYPNNKHYTNEAGKVSQITLSIGKNWIGIDKSGVMGWNNIIKKNFYWIFTARNGRAF